MPIKYYARFETGAEDLIGPTVGPFRECLQLSYYELREGEEGETIAHYSAKHDWRCCVDGEDHDASYSDVILYAEED